MSAFTLQNTPFPEGTSVSAYDAQGYSTFPTGGPPGTPVATATVTGGALTFTTGLTDHRSYFAAAFVSGQWANWRFTPGENGPAPRIPDAVDYAGFGAGRSLVVKDDESGFEFKDKGGPDFTFEEFGAVGDDETDNTAAMQRALDAIHALGGGTVIFGDDGIFRHGELVAYDNTTVDGPGLGAVSKRLDESDDAYLWRNANTGAGNDNITLRGFAIDGNKANIAGDRSEDVNPSCEVRFVADDAHRCTEIHVDLYQHDAKRLGIAWANVEGGSMKGLILNNGRDAFTLQSNCSNIDLGYEARGCGDDGLGINAEQDPNLTHDLHDIRGRVAIYGPGDDGPGLGVTIRGGRDIDIDLFANDVDGWGLAIFDAYATETKDIAVRGTTRRCGGDAAFYSKAAVVIAAGVIHAAEGSYAAIKNVSLDELRVIDPSEVAIEVKSARTAYGSLSHIDINKPIIKGATKAILLGDYLSHINIDRPGILECGDGIVSTATHVLRLRVRHPDIYQVTGTGVLIENATTGVIEGIVVSNDGTNGQTGIKLKALAGTWHIANNHAFECTTNYNYGEIGTPTITDGFFGKAPTTKPSALTAATSETIDGTYGEQEKKTIENLRTRVNDLESRLQGIGLLS